MESNKEASSGSVEQSNPAREAPASDATARPQQQQQAAPTAADSNFLRLPGTGTSAAAMRDGLSINTAVGATTDAMPRRQTNPRSVSYMTDSSTANGRMHNSLPSRRFCPPANESRDAAISARRPSIAIQRLPSSISVREAARNAAALTQQQQDSQDQLGGNRHRSITIATPGLHEPHRRSNAPRSAYPRLGHNAYADASDTGPAIASPNAAPQSARPVNDRDFANEANDTVEDNIDGAASGGMMDRLRGLRRRAATAVSPSNSVGQALGQTGRGRSGSITSQLSSNRGGDASAHPTSAARADAYDNDIADLLDALDPEVQMLNTLGDIQNTWFIPHTGLFDRTRKVNLTKPPSTSQLAPLEPIDGSTDTSPASSSPVLDSEKKEEGKDGKSLPAVPAPPSAAEAAGEVVGPSTAIEMKGEKVGTATVHRGEYFVVSSKLVDMSGWTEQEKADLDDYVRHLLHSRKERLNRKWRAFGKYVRTRAYTTVCL